MTMTIAVAPPRKKETRTNTQYAELVRGFPPRPIHNERQYDATVEVMNRFAVRDENMLSVRRVIISMRCRFSWNSMTANIIPLRRINAHHWIA